jgi:membrane protease subunit HflC
MLKDERTAQSRLEDIIGSETRSAIASHDLIEVVRNDKQRTVPIELQDPSTNASPLRLAKRGRVEIEQDILKAAAPNLLPFGIELIDVRIKRVNYNADVLTPIHQRMISERMQIAQRHRSEGEGEAARILGKKERELRTLESEAYRQVQEVRGGADAEASRIYAEAYDQTEEAREFYGFLKTLDTYRAVLGKDTKMVLSTDSDLFRLFKQAGK